MRKVNSPIPTVIGKNNRKFMFFQRYGYSLNGIANYCYSSYVLDRNPMPTVRSIMTDKNPDAQALFTYLPMGRPNDNNRDTVVIYLTKDADGAVTDVTADFFPAKIDPIYNMIRRLCS